MHRGRARRDENGKCIRERGDQNTSAPRVKMEGVEKGEEKEELEGGGAKDEDKETGE